MALIVALTDFSAVGENATNYSCNLALTAGASVLVIHSFVFPAMFSDVQIPATLMNETQRDAEKKMGELIVSLTGLYPSLEIKGKVVYGDVIDAIESQIAEAGRPWLVIAGNSNTSEHSTWFESTLNDAGKHLKVPLLAVPPQAAYKPVTRLCFAYDNMRSGAEHALSQVADFSRELNAELHVLNVREEGGEEVTRINDTAGSILAEAYPKYHFEQSNTIDEVILNFNDSNNIDWLMIMPRRHSFFQGLFHKSHTKNIAQHCMIPVLLLHEDDNRR